MGYEDSRYADPASKSTLFMVGSVVLWAFPVIAIFAALWAYSTLWTELTSVSGQAAQNAATNAMKFIAVAPWVLIQTAAIFQLMFRIPVNPLGLGEFFMSLIGRVQPLKDTPRELVALRDKWLLTAGAVSLSLFALIPSARMADPDSALGDVRVWHVIAGCGVAAAAGIAIASLAKRYAWLKRGVEFQDRRLEPAPDAIDPRWRQFLIESRGDSMLGMVGAATVWFGAHWALSEGFFIDQNAPVMWWVAVALGLVVLAAGAYAATQYHRAGDLYVDTEYVE